jgi:hypothetical protein
VRTLGTAVEVEMGAIMLDEVQSDSAMESESRPDMEQAEIGNKDSIL